MGEGWGGTRVGGWEEGDDGLGWSGRTAGAGTGFPSRVGGDVRWGDNPLLGHTWGCGGMFVVAKSLCQAKLGGGDGCLTAVHHRQPCNRLLSVQGEGGRL